MTETETYFHRDVESFQNPLLSAIDECRRAFVAAAKRVEGAEARTRAAVDELTTLREFCDAIEDHLKSRSFHTLPRVKRGRDTLDGFHHLTVASWRGIFLVAQSGSQVLALVFSKAPHHMDDRLDELAARHSATPPQRDPGVSGRSR